MLADVAMILDAIKRSKEGETTAQGVPSIDTEHYVPREPQSRLPWFVAGVSVLLLVVISVWQFAGKATPVTEAVDEPEQTPRPTTKAPPDSRSSEVVNPVSNTSTNQAPEVSEGAAQAVVAQSSNAVAGTVADIPSMPDVAGPSSEKPNQGELAALYDAMNEDPAVVAPEVDAAPTNEVAVAAAEVNEPRIDLVEILERAQREMGKTPLVESSVPLLDSLSQQTKDQIPSLVYSEHSYQEFGESTVMMNGQTVRENQRIGSFVLVEILPDSAILRWRDVEFRLRARNSWINL